MSDHNHQQQLIKNGYFKVSGLIPEGMISDLQQKSATVIDNCTDEHRASVKSNGTMCNIAKMPQFADIISFKPIIDTLKEIGGTDVRWTGGYLISKPAGGPPLFWHQDWWGWDDLISYENTPVQLFVMIYLSETTADNGCLKAIPGSHRKAHELHQLNKAHSDELIKVKNPDDPAFAKHKDEVPAPAIPGDIIVGDARLLHAANGNTGDHERPLLTLWYTPSFNTLPEAIRAQYVKAIKSQADDIIDGSNGTALPHQWPTAQRDKLAPIYPIYAGDTPPLNWNREPDLNKMK